MASHIVYIGLGSNLGNGRENLNKAVRLLGERIGEVLATSNYVKSEPWGFESTNLFTNGVTVLRTDLSPIEVLDRTEQIEREMGRTQKHKAGENYTDRVIDLDIIIYDDVHIETDRLTIPHPHYQKRTFVTAPLIELASKALPFNPYNNI